MKLSSRYRYFLLVVLVFMLLSCGAQPGGSVRGDTFTSKTVTVSAKTQWTSTGVSAAPGTRLKIRYISGQWSPWPGGAYDAIGSGGDPRCDCNVIMGVSHAALIARIGDSQPFLVGDFLELRIGESGELYLGINDTDRADNSGSLEVDVQVQNR